MRRGQNSDGNEVGQGAAPLTPINYPGRIYVKAGATGAATGASWADAYTNLQDGLSAAWPGSAIWVAAGTYRPDQGKGITPGNRNATFTLKPDVAIYGGFSGTETTLAGRGYLRNKSILSGDLAGNDGLFFTHKEENSIHFVTFTMSLPVAPLPPALLDGVTISGSYAYGMYVNYTSPMVRNCLITGNGGGIDISYGNPRFENCLILSNSGGSFGGAIFVSSGAPVFSGCTVMYNNAISYGGGIYVNEGTNTRIENSIFWGNTASYGKQILAQGNGLSVLSSDIQGGLAGIDYYYTGTTVTYQDNIDLEPLLTPDGHLQPGSPCIDAGAPALGFAADRDGEARPQGMAPDMGADEFVDSDHDGLADVWEQHWFGSLGAIGSTDADGDGLDNGTEYRFGTNPSLADSDSDGYADGSEVAQGTIH